MPAVRAFGRRVSVKPPPRLARVPSQIAEVDSRSPRVLRGRDQIGIYIEHLCCAEVDLGHGHHIRERAADTVSWKSCDIGRRRSCGGLPWQRAQFCSYQNLPATGSAASHCEHIRHPITSVGMRMPPAPMIPPGLTSSSSRGSATRSHSRGSGRRAERRYRSRCCWPHSGHCRAPAPAPRPQHRSSPRSRQPPRLH